MTPKRAWRTLSQVKDDYIQQVVEHCDTVEEASRTLGVNSSTLRRRKKRLEQPVQTIAFPGTEQGEAIATELHIWALQRLQEQRLDAEIASWRQWYKDLGRTPPVTG